MELEDLRNRIAEIDRHILELAAERQQVVRTVGELKDHSGTALRSFAQEKIVLERARAEAERLGLSPELAVDLVRRLIHESLTLQERQRVEVAGGGSGRKALVIGGAGRMGRWMARFLAAQDFAVEVADPQPIDDDFNRFDDWRDSGLDHDVIVVAATLRASREILEGLAERRPSGVVFDVGSLKTPLRGALERLVEAGVDVASIHPMFGPDTELLSGRHVILVDLGCPTANSAVRELFSSTMAEMVEMGLDDHDRVIAFVLGLSHALNIAFVTALAASGETVPELAGLSSTTFDRQLGVTQAVTQENPHLYFEIQHLNAHGKQPLTALQAAVGEIERIVDAGDEEAFVGLMERGRRYFAERIARPAAP